MAQYTDEENTNAPLGALSFIHVEIYAIEFGPEGPVVPKIGVD